MRPVAVLIFLGLGILPACGESPAPLDPPRPQVSAGQDPEVQALLESALGNLLAAPGDLSLRREYAMLLDANGLDQSAQLAWQQVLELDPNSAEGFYHLSKVSERNGQADLCLEAIQASIALEPNYAPSQARLGRLLMENGALEQSEAAFRKALQLDSKSSRAALGLARLCLARGDVAGATAQLNPLLERNPREPLVHGLLARAAVLAGDTQSAEAHLAAEEAAGSASGSDPWSAEVRRRATGLQTRITRAKAALERGDASAALAQLEPLWERRQSEQSVVETLCEIRLSMGQPEQVLSLLEETQAGFVQAYSLLLYRARAERALGQDERALEAAQAAAELNPRRREAAGFSGQLHFDLGQYAEASAALARARENGDQSLQTWVYLARATAWSGSLEAGIQELDAAIASYPLIPKPWAYRAELLAQAGRQREAEESLAKAQALGLAGALVESTRETLALHKSKVH